MLELRRTVRFTLGGGVQGRPRHNTFSAWPAMRGLGRYYELDVACRGKADPRTGYFINIKRIDEAVREHVLPELEYLVTHLAIDPITIGMGEVMRQALHHLQPPLEGSVASIRLALTPYLSLTLGAADMASVLIRQQYDFSAAHRLHVPDLSIEENLKIFGKCNNPAGHGHNYRVEVAVRAPIDIYGHTIDPETLDAIVDENAIEKLDHKHLNLDVPEFEKINPSVENISRVVWNMLQRPIEGIDATLEEVSVWETAKTVCTYRGD